MMTARVRLRPLALAATLVPLACAKIDGEPAHSRYVILTDVSQGDPYLAAAERLRAHRRARIVRFQPGRLPTVRERLQSIRPEFVALVVKPRTLDVNFAYDVLELSTKLDDDPFPDFAYGFITGATAAGAQRFVENIIRAEASKGTFPLKLFAFGTSSTPQADDDNVFEWLPGWKRLRVGHECGAFPQERLPELAACGVIRFWGHGTPSKIDGSLSFKDMRNLDLFPAVVFAGPCYSAVVATSYNWEDGSRVKADYVSPGESLALSFLASGATGYFGALHEDRCLSAGQEMEFALTHDVPLGLASKFTYDAVVMALRGKALAAPRLRKGAAPPQEDSAEFQIHRAAGRILLGDPAFQPFRRVARSPLTVAVHREGRGLRISAKVIDPRLRCLFTNVFHSDLCECGTDNDVLYLKIELPPDVGKLRRVSRIPLACPKKCDTCRLVHWAEELWFGKRFLHVQMDYRHDLIKGKATEVEFFVDTAAR